MQFQCTLLGSGETKQNKTYPETDALPIGIECVSSKPNALWTNVTKLLIPNLCKKENKQKPQHKTTINKHKRAHMTKN